MFNWVTVRAVWGPRQCGELIVVLLQPLLSDQSSVTLSIVLLKDGTVVGEDFQEDIPTP